MNKYLAFLITFLTFGISTSQAQKKPLDHSVYDTWENIGRSLISPSGKIIFFEVNRQDADNYAVLNKENNLNLKIDRSAQGLIFDNEKYFISLVKPLHEESKKEKRKPKKERKELKDELLIYHLETEDKITFDNVSSHKTAFFAKEFVAFTTIEKDSIAKEESDTSKIHNQELKKLHIYNLDTGKKHSVNDVEEYTWSPHEKYLVYTVKVNKKDSLRKGENGVYLYEVGKGQTKKILGERNSYKNFVFDDQEQKLVFLADTSDKEALLKDYEVFFYTPALDSAKVLLTKNSAGVPKDWYIQPEGRLSFSDSGERLFVGLSPIPAIKDTSLFEDEHAKLDIWHWKDDYLQPYQLVNQKKERNKSYPAVYHFTNNKLISLANPKIDRISFGDSGDEEWALFTSDYGNRIETQWTYTSLQNIGLISLTNGDTLQIVKDFDGRATLSPNADYVLLFDREQALWKSFSVTDRKTRSLNEHLEISFVDEDHDMPSLPNPYGIAGWSEDGKKVALYDKYDIWYFDLESGKHDMLTKGFGRNNNLVFRYPDLVSKKNLRPKKKIIDPSKSIILTAFDEVSKKNGLYRFYAKKKNPEVLFLGEYVYKNFQASEDGKKIIYTQENYEQSPNLFSYDFAVSQQESDTNPQQKDYNWGTAELVHWTTPQGFAAEGILYKPEDFDPNKKYPIIAYFYERLSQGLYSYHAPAPTPSRLNISYFVSNGYLVFAPDIRYKTGFPGASAEEYVNSGMKMLAEKPWVNEEKMGIQGQSWGGYQVAHLITRTDMYAAAWSGAPVVNMTSAYGGIRWATGMSRQFQYEKTQSRLGKNLWEGFDLYIENSPLFHMQHVKTPVAIMHNDNDGAVPWYQGIEMFTALRRLNKPVWLLNYNGDEHNLMKRQNRKDIQRREQQFFDHFLKDKPAAPWIENGIPAIKKGIDWGF